MVQKRAVKRADNDDYAGHSNGSGPAGTGEQLCTRSAVYDNTIMTNRS